jgi:integrase
VSLDEQTLGVLREHRRRQLADRLAAGEAWQARPYGLDLIFRDELGAGLRPQRVLRALQAACRRAGVPVVPFHGMRHFAAVMHARVGTPRTVAAEILGHDVRLLEGVYQAHAQPDLAADAVRRIASALRDE